MVRARLVLSIVAALCNVELARAEAPAAADVLFEQAREEMRQGNYAAAYAKLLESQRVDPSNGTLLNLIVCEEKLGKIASAWQHAAELVERLPETDERKSIAERRVAALSARVPRLVVRRGASVPLDTKVLLDGTELDASSFGVPLPIDPGPHGIVVRTSGQADRVERLSLVEAQTLEWRVRSAEPEQAFPRQPPVPRASASPRREASKSPPDVAESKSWIGWTIVGAGAAALTSAAVLGLMTLDRKSDVENVCPPPERRCRDASGVEMADEGKRLFNGTLIAAGVGAAGIGIGLYLLTHASSSAHATESVHPTGIVGAYVGSF